MGLGRSKSSRPRVLLGAIGFKVLPNAWADRLNPAYAALARSP